MSNISASGTCTIFVYRCSRVLWGCSILEFGDDRHIHSNTTPPWRSLKEVRPGLGWKKKHAFGRTCGTPYIDVQGPCWLYRYCWWRITCNSFLLKPGIQLPSLLQIAKWYLFATYANHPKECWPKSCNSMVDMNWITVFLWCQMVYHPPTVIIRADFVHQAVLKVPKTIII